jgi:hypothetical protein
LCLAVQGEYPEMVALLLRHGGAPDLVGWPGTADGKVARASAKMTLAGKSPRCSTAMPTRLSAESLAKL